MKGFKIVMIYTAKDGEGGNLMKKNCAELSFFPDEL